LAALTLIVEPLNREAFAPFGSVMETEGAELRLINGGTTERFHRLAVSDTDAEGRTIVSLFRGQPRTFPFPISMMERHPDGSQAFFPLDRRDWLLAVAEDDNGRPARPRVFRASGAQGVSYGRNVWHHPLMALGEVSDFLVVDREGPGPNLEEYFYPEPFVIEAAGLTKRDAP
jgi:ureidoglycolate lyase